MVHSQNSSVLLLLAAVFVLAAAAWSPPAQLRAARKTCQARDGVRIVYNVAGTAEPALVFIHGGFANRQFWDGELKAFAPTHRVIALDLPAHGESGANRTKWGLPEYGADVKAVADAEGVRKMIIFGNSLGGPVAIEAALAMPGRVIGVVGVDTFQRIDYVIQAEETRARAEAFRDNYATSLKEMVKALFHPDTDPALVADAERRMSGTPPQAAYQMFLGMIGYDMGAACRRLSVPLRAINGDLYLTDVAANRKVKPDFDVVVMKHIGHYPMLERSGEFDRHVSDVVQALMKAGQ
jgi:pimeloyl-ACP methyl ester carboxylesterase